MPTIKEALKLALDALQKSFPPDGSKYEVELEQKHREAIAAIQELLDRSVADPEPIGYMQKVIEALYENGDPVSIDAAELLERISAPAPKAITASNVDADIEYWRQKYLKLDAMYDELEKEKIAIEQNLMDRT